MKKLNYKDLDGFKKLLNKVDVKKLDEIKFLLKKINKNSKNYKDERSELHTPGKWEIYNEHLEMDKETNFDESDVEITGWDDKAEETVNVARVPFDNREDARHIVQIHNSFIDNSDRDTPEQERED